MLNLRLDESETCLFEIAGRESTKTQNDDKKYLLEHKKSFMKYHKESIDEYRKSAHPQVRKSFKIIEHLQNRISV